MSDRTPESSFALQLAKKLTAAERLLATDAWWTYVQLVQLANQPNPEQAESERIRLDRATGRIGGVWQGILVAHGYDFQAWEIRLRDLPKDIDPFAEQGVLLPAEPVEKAANLYGVYLVAKASAQ